MKQKMEDLERQHKENYRKAIYDTIDDNTDKLIQEDSVPLFKEPPLASMDVLKSKILEKAKEEKIILSTEQLDKVIHDFRSKMLVEVLKIGDYRRDGLHNCMENVIEKEEFEEDQIENLFQDVREKMRSLFEKKLEYSLQEDVIPNLSTLFQSTKNNTPDSIDNFLISVSKYLTYRYPEQLIDAFVDKILLKDQILLNRLKEHNERYCFTKTHSHLLNNDQQSVVIKKEKRS